ncbi:MAG TPA: FAD-dependent oxidoreductase [Candidatus Limnocylindrales bacterium]|nr:FAD-dependent oxidoreductase [Candidatus Limnocylindrales bacterium]
MRVAVIGAGIVGLAIARECGRRGHEVTVHDPSPGSGASHVAAGMLAPVGESYFGEPELTRLLVECARVWPSYAAGFGADVGYDPTGTLQIGLTGDDVRGMARLWEHQRSLGFEVEKVVPSQVEPLVTARARGVRVPSDHQVNPRLVVRALLGMVSVTAAPVGETDVTVVAAGCGSAAWGLPVRPVKGVLLRLRGETGLKHVIRGLADSREIYLVPRKNAEIIVGATSEERSDKEASAGAVRDLLRAATDLVPELAEHALAEVSVGHRPGTPDNAPIVGELRPGLLVATGHYRHGVLAAPLTAMAIADLVDGREMPEVWKPFGPGRFL